MHIFNYLNRLEYDIKKARMPITAAIGVLLIGVLLMQQLVEVTMWQMISCTVLFIAYAIFHWYSDRLLLHIHIFYFLIQSSFILSCVLIVPIASPIIFLGLASLFVIQTIFYYRHNAIRLAIIGTYALFYITMMLHFFNGQYIWLFIFLLVMLFIFIHVILYLFSEQEAENLQLQRANKKIRQLTIQNERQRMARDLHDNLAQQLVGLILKLEASEVHLDKENYHKAETIIRSAKDQAKVTLVEARSVIDDLRISEMAKTFQHVVEEELTDLAFQYKIKIDVQIEAIRVTPTIQSNVLSMLREAVTNVYKHAKAEIVQVNVVQRQNEMHLSIRDDGIGIDVDDALKKPGHYGLMGIGERVDLLNGTWEINNEQGTLLFITIPL